MPIASQPVTPSLRSDDAPRPHGRTQVQCTVIGAITIYRTCVPLYQVFMPYNLNPSQQPTKIIKRNLAPLRFKLFFQTHYRFRLLFFQPELNLPQAGHETFWNLPPILF